MKKYAEVHMEIILLRSLSMARRWLKGLMLPARSAYQGFQPTSKCDKKAEAVELQGGEEGRGYA
ncbi:MAG: hypothetical protein QW506_00115 [Thermoproteota archaeon]